MIVDWSAPARRPRPTRPAPVILRAPPERHVAAARQCRHVRRERAPQSPPRRDVAAGAAPRHRPGRHRRSPSVAHGEPAAAAAAPRAGRHARVGAGAYAARTSTVELAPGGSEITPAGHALLDTVAGQLCGATPGSRLELIAYASGTGDDAIEARRISLARALADARLSDRQGRRRASRMDVRALGNRNVGDGPADRVDLVISRSMRPVAAERTGLT